MSIDRTGNTEALYAEEFIFDPQAESHGHVHASCIVECPSGDLRAVWYENGKELPPPYFSGNRDKSDDVRIGGSRKPQGADAWEKPFVMSDTFGLSSNNPCMVIDSQDRLWLVHPTLLGVPKWTWGSALLRYSISSQYNMPGRPIWDKVDILVPHIPELEQMEPENPLKSRLGWMSRAHPFIRSDGAVIIPLANENFDIAVMAITQDGGETWTFSKPVPGGRVTQPSLVEFSDGNMSAFFRSSKRIRRSDSSDGGVTWSELAMTELPHPGAGIEATMLRNGHLLMIYNDREDAATGLQFPYPQMEVRRGNGRVILRILQEDDLITRRSSRQRITHFMLPIATTSIPSNTSISAKHGSLEGIMKYEIIDCYFHPAVDEGTGTSWFYPAGSMQHQR